MTRRPKFTVIKSTYTITWKLSPIPIGGIIKQKRSALLDPHELKIINIIIVKRTILSKITAFKLCSTKPRRLGNVPALKNYLKFGSSNSSTEVPLSEVPIVTS